MAADPLREPPDRAIRSFAPGRRLPDGSVHGVPTSRNPLTLIEQFPISRVRTVTAAEPASRPPGTSAMACLSSNQRSIFHGFGSARLLLILSLSGLSSGAFSAATAVERSPFLSTVRPEVV